MSNITTKCLEALELEILVQNAWRVLVMKIPNLSIHLHIMNSEVYNVSTKSFSS